MNEIKQYLSGRKKRSRTFTTTGSFTVPAGVTEVFVTGGGAGGGGAGGQTDSYGGAGGTTSFGNLLSLPGGGGGQAAGAGGLGGQAGQNMYQQATAVTNVSGKGGDSGPYKGGLGGSLGPVTAAYTKGNQGGYCSGGGAGGQNNVTYAAGGGGHFVFDYPLSVTPGATYTITIGQGGTGGPVSTAGAVNAGGYGGNGILTVEWWE